MESLGEPYFLYERRTGARPRAGFTCTRLLPARTLPDMAAEVRASLSAAPKRLSPKYFYDRLGAALFERICETPEYYPTRTEHALLVRHADEVIETVGPQTLIEIGSGSARKIEVLLRACAAQGCYARYMPLDVCRDSLVTAGHVLTQTFDWLAVDALEGDYGAGLANLPPARGPRLFLFLGGTLGNFEPDAAHAFLRDLREAMYPNDWLLLGADRIKAPALLHAAYNDAAGYTAAFNLNVLNVLNRRLGSDFDPRAFAHEAHYNEAAQRVEMTLRARSSQVVRFARPHGFRVEFRRDERILTEISRKFARETLSSLFHRAGLAFARHFEAESQAFSLVLARIA